MKIGDESILFFSRVSLSKFSLEALFLSWVKGVFILGWEWNVKSQVFQNRASLRLDWVASSSREVTKWPVVLFCPVVLQLAWRFNFWHAWHMSSFWQFLATCSCESPTRSSRESLFFLHTLEHFFTLSHSLPLQESHLNTWSLITEIQANLARNKADKMVDKIQPYISFFLSSSSFSFLTKRSFSFSPTLSLSNWCSLQIFKKKKKKISLPSLCGLIHSHTLSHGDGKLGFWVDLYFAKWVFCCVLFWIDFALSWF